MLAFEAAMDELAYAAASTQSNCASATSRPSTRNRQALLHAPAGRLLSGRREAVRLGAAAGATGTLREGRWLIGYGMSAAIRTNFMAPSQGGRS